jgi:CHAT domain-containing protein
LAHRLGRDGEARALFERYLATLRPDDGVARWDSEVHLAEIEARQGRASIAARRLAAAAAALESWRAAQSDSTLRLLAFQASTHEESDRDATFAAAIAALVAHGEVSAAFEQVERRRARTLGERIVQADALRGGAGSRRIGATASRRATAGEIAATLPDDRTALLEYVTGAAGSHTTLFVVTRGGVRAERLASVDSLLPSVRRFLAAIDAGEESTAGARTLGAALIAPAVRGLDPRIERLTLVPDGALHRVPFDALRLDDGRTVLERFETSIAPSAAVATLLRQRPASRSPAEGRVLAFGDPAFAGEREPEAGSPVIARGALDTTGLARLRESGREARIAASYGTGSVARLRAEASAAYLKRAPLDSFSVLHLATHAVVDERSLARSAIVLAPSAGETGALSPGDLAALPLGVDLVVLSACRSAGGVLVNGEGVQGLTAPLLAAGARAVVATGWPVDDRATVALVEELYRALAAGQPVGSALRTAKLAALRRGLPVREWASFAVIGDPLVVVPLQAPRRMPWSVVFAASLTVAVIMVLAVRRRRTA